MTEARSLSILGSTGSIGTSALSVVAHANAQETEPVFEIDTLCAGKNVDLLIEQALHFRPTHVVIADESQLDALRVGLSGLDIEIAGGAGAVIEAATRPVHRDLAAIVGIALGVLAAAILTATAAIMISEALSERASIPVDEQGFS